MLRCRGLQNVVSFSPQDTSRCCIGCTATQCIRYQQALKLSRIGQQFLAIMALLLSATSLTFYIESGYEISKIATVTAHFCVQFTLAIFKAYCNTHVGLFHICCPILCSQNNLPLNWKQTTI